MASTLFAHVLRMFATWLDGVCYCYAVAVIQSVIVWLVFGVERTGVWTLVVAWFVLLCIPLVVVCLCFVVLFLPRCSFFLLHVVHFVYVSVWAMWCVFLCGVGVLLLDILRQLFGI